MVSTQFRKDHQKLQTSKVNDFGGFLWFEFNIKIVAAIYITNDLSLV
jgi:hypothetical protein